MEPVVLSIDLMNATTKTKDLGNGLPIQTAVMMYRIHASLLNRRVSLTTETSSGTTAFIAAQEKIIPAAQACGR